MKAIPQMKAVMTPFPYWIGIEESLEQARRMMDDHAIRHLPVMRDGTLVSVLAYEDLDHASHGGGGKVSEICRSGPYVVGLAEPLDRVLLHMAEHHLDSVVVVKDGKLAGIFTVSDACRRFGTLLRTLFPGSGDDAA